MHSANARTHSPPGYRFSSLRMIKVPEQEKISLSLYREPGRPAKRPFFKGQCTDLNQSNLNSECIIEIFFQVRIPRGLPCEVSITRSGIMDE